MKGLVLVGSMAMFVKAMWEICSNNMVSAFFWTLLFGMGMGFFALLYRVEMIRRMKSERRI